MDSICYSENYLQALNGWRRNLEPQSLAEDFRKRLEEKRRLRADQFKNIKMVDYSEWADENEKGRVKLPNYVKSLIHNPAYENRVKFLVRKHGVEYIKKLAEVAHTKAKPQNWFAKCYSKENWEKKTIPFLEKMMEKAKEMKEKLKKIGISMKYLAFYISAEKKLGKSVMMELIEKAQSPKVKNPEYYLRGAIKKEYGKLKGL